MAYKFPKPKDYSIKRAQKRLELTDDELEECLENRWLRLALRNTAIPYPHPGNGYYAALPFAHAEHLPDELQQQIDMLRPLPDYLYYAGQHLPTGAVVFDDFSHNSFLLMSVHRSPTKTEINNARVGPPIYARSEIDPNAEAVLKVKHVGLWDLAFGILNKTRKRFDAHKVLRSCMVVPEEEIERFQRTYGQQNTDEIYSRLNTEQRNSRWQEWANEIGQELAAKGEDRTKEIVAKELKRRHPDVHQTADTVRRIISRQWS